ncbi:MAG: TrkA C-terminal domain-containing protein, partial [Candidatus Bipolaricaulia bacterium]
VVKDIKDKPYLYYAGADVVVSPREIMGLALADKALSGTPFHLSDLTSIAPDLEIIELPVHPGSPLIAQTLTEAEVGERTGARVIGVWSKGEFISAPGPETRIDEGSVLVAAGSKGQLERLEALALSSRRRALREGEGRVVVLGCGEVGRRLKELLRERGIAPLMVDLEEGPEVDLVGDALEEETLKRAGIGEARTLIVALDDDIRGIFAILIARRLNPQLQIVARANEEEMVNRMYRAGANYVLSLAAVGGRALASHLLGREVIALGKRVRIERLPLPPRLIGKTIGQARVRGRTGCTVVAVERQGRTEVEVPSQFKFREGDTIIISGSDENIQKFHRRFGKPPAPGKPS